jgi:hypothetical protein
MNIYKLKVKLKQLMNISVLAGAACLTASQASAESASFTLPIRVHWGNLVVEPGKYTLNVPLARSWPQEVVLNQAGGRFRIFPIMEAGGISSSRSYLQLVDVGGSYFVREYVSASTGKVFTFWVPKKLSRALNVEAKAKALPVNGTRK